MAAFAQDAAGVVVVGRGLWEGEGVRVRGVRMHRVRIVAKAHVRLVIVLPCSSEVGPAVKGEACASKVEILQ